MANTKRIYQGEIAVAVSIDAKSQANLSALRETFSEIEQSTGMQKALKNLSSFATKMERIGSIDIGGQLDTKSLEQSIIKLAKRVPEMIALGLNQAKSSQQATSVSSFINDIVERGIERAEAGRGSSQLLKRMTDNITATFAQDLQQSFARGKGLDIDARIDEIVTQMNESFSNVDTTGMTESQLGALTKLRNTFELEMRAALDIAKGQVEATRGLYADLDAMADKSQQAAKQAATDTKDLIVETIKKTRTGRKEVTTQPMILKNLIALREQSAQGIAKSLAAKPDETTFNKFMERQGEQLVQQVEVLTEGIEDAYAAGLGPNILTPFAAQLDKSLGLILGTVDQLDKLSINVVLDEQADNLGIRLENALGVLNQLREKMREANAESFEVAEAREPTGSFSKGTYLDELTKRFGQYEGEMRKRFVNLSLLGVENAEEFLKSWVTTKEGLEWISDEIIGHSIIPDMFDAIMDTVVSFETALDRIPMFAGIRKDAELTYDELFGHSVFPDIITHLKVALQDMQDNVESVGAFGGLTGQAQELYSQFDALEGRMDGLAQNYRDGFETIAKVSKSSGFSAVSGIGPQVTEQREIYKLLQQELTTRRQLKELEKQQVAAKGTQQEAVIEKRIETYHQLMYAVEQTSRSEQAARRLHQEAVNTYSDLDETIKSSTGKALPALETIPLKAKTVLAQLGRTQGEFFQAWRQGFIELSASGKYTTEELRDAFLEFDKTIVENNGVGITKTKTQFRDLKNDMVDAIGNTRKMWKKGLAEPGDVSTTARGLTQAFHDEITTLEVAFEELQREAEAAALRGEVNLANQKQAQSGELRKALEYARTQEKSMLRVYKQLQTDLVIAGAGDVAQLNQQLDNTVVGLDILEDRHKNAYRTIPRFYDDIIKTLTSRLPQGLQVFDKVFDNVDGANRRLEDMRGGLVRVVSTAEKLIPLKLNPLAAKKELDRSFEVAHKRMLGLKEDLNLLQQESSKMGVATSSDFRDVQLEVRRLGLMQDKFRAKLATGEKVSAAEMEQYINKVKEVGYYLDRIYAMPGMDQVDTERIFGLGMKGLRTAIETIALDTPKAAFDSYERSLTTMEKRVGKKGRKIVANAEELRRGVISNLEVLQVRASRGLLPDVNKAESQLKKQMHPLEKQYKKLLAEIERKSKKGFSKEQLAPLEELAATVGNILQDVEKKSSKTFENIRLDIEKNSATAQTALESFMQVDVQMHGAGTGRVAEGGKKSRRDRRAAKEERALMAEVIGEQRFAEAETFLEKLAARIEVMRIESSGLSEATSLWGRALTKTHGIIDRFNNPLRKLTKHQELVYQMAENSADSLHNIVTRSTKISPKDFGLDPKAFSQINSGFKKLQTTQLEITKQVKGTGEITTTQLGNFEKNIEEIERSLEDFGDVDENTPLGKVLTTYRKDLEELDKRLDIYNSIEKGNERAGKAAQTSARQNTFLGQTFTKLKSVVSKTTRQGDELNNSTKEQRKRFLQLGSTVGKVALKFFFFDDAVKVFGAGIKTVLGPEGLVGLQRRIGEGFYDLFRNLTSGFGEVNNRVQSYMLSLESFFEGTDIEAQRKTVAKSLNMTVAEYKKAELSVADTQQQFNKLGKERMTRWLNDMLQTTGFTAEQIQDLGKKLLSQGLSPEEWGRPIADMVEKAGGGAEKLDQVMTHVGKMNSNLAEGFYGLTEALAIGRDDVKVWYATMADGSQQAVEFFDAARGEALTVADLLDRLGLSQVEAAKRFSDAAVGELDLTLPIKNMTKAQLEALQAFQKGGSSLVDDSGKLVGDAEEALGLIKEYATQSGIIAGQSAKQSLSLDTAWGNVKDTIQALMVDFGSPIWNQTAVALNGLMDGLNEDGPQGVSVIAELSANLKDAGEWAADIMEVLLKPERWKGAYTVLKGLWGVLHNIMQLNFGGVASSLEDVFAGVKQMFGGTVEEAKSWGSNVVESMSQGIQRSANSLWNSVKGMLSTIRSYLPFSPVKAGPLKGLEKSGGKIVDQLTTGIYGKRGEMNRASDLLANSMGSGFATIRSNLSAYNRGAFGFGTSFMNTFAGGLVAAGKSSVFGAMSYVGSLLGQLQGHSPPPIAPTLIKDGANVSHQFARGIIGGGSAINSAVGGIATRFSGLRNESKQWGRNISGTFTEGIVEQGKKSIAPAMEQIGGMVNSYLKGHSPPKVGPLSTIDKDGANIATVFSDTMGQAFKKTKRDAEEMLSPMKDAFDGVVDKARDTKDKLVVHSEIPDMMSMMRVVVADKGPEIVDAFRNKIAEPLTAAAGEMKSTVVNEARDMARNLTGPFTQVSQYANGMFSGFDMSTFGMFDSAIGLVRGKLDMLNANIENGSVATAHAMGKVRLAIANGLRGLSSGLPIGEIMGTIQSQLGVLLGQSNNLMGVIQAEFQSHTARQAADALASEIEAAKNARQAQLDAAQESLNALQERISAAKERRQSALDSVQEEIDGIKEFYGVQKEAIQDDIDAIDELIDAHNDNKDEAQDAIDDLDSRLEDEVDARLEALGMVADEDRIRRLQNRIESAQRDIDEAQRVADSIGRTSDTLGINVMTVSERNAVAALNLAEDMKSALEGELDAEEEKKQMREDMLENLKASHKAEYASYEARIKAAEEAIEAQNEIKEELAGHQEALTKAEEEQIAPLEQRLEALQKADEAATKAEEAKLKSAQDHVNKLQKGIEAANKADDARLVAANANAEKAAQNAELLRKAYEAEQAALQDKLATAEGASGEEAGAAEGAMGGFEPPSFKEVEDTIVSRARNALETMGQGASDGIVSGFKTLITNIATGINTRFGEIFDISGLFETVEVRPGVFEQKLKPIDKMLGSLFKDLGDTIAGFLGFEDIGAMLKAVVAPIGIIAGILGGPAIIGAITAIGGALASVSAPAIGLVAGIIAISAAIKGAFVDNGERMGEIMDRLSTAFGRILPMFEKGTGEGVDFGKILGAVVGFVIKLADGIGKTLAPLLIGLIEIVVSVIEVFADIREGIGDFINALKSGDIKGAGKALLKVLVAPFKGLVKVIGSIGEGIFKAIGELVAGVFDLIPGKGELAEAIRDWFEGAVDFVTGIFDRMIDAALGFVDRLIGHSILTDFAADVMQLFKNLFVELPRKVIKGLLDIINKIKTNAPQLLSAAGEWIRGLPTAIGTAISEGVTNIVNGLTKMIGNITERAPELLQEAKSLFTNFVTGAKEKFDEVLDSVGGWISGITSNISATAGNVLAAAQGVWDNFKNAASTAFTDVKNSAPGWMQGIIGSIETKLEGLKQAASNLWNGFTSKSKEVLDAFTNTQLGQIMSSMAGKLTDGTYIQEFKNAAGTLFQGFADAFSLAAQGDWGGALTALREAVRGSVGQISLIEDARNVFSTFVSGAKSLLVGEGDWGSPAEGSFLYNLFHMFDGITTVLGSAFDGVFGGVLDSIKLMANGVVEQINAAISAIEGTIDEFHIDPISFDKPDWMGGGTVTIFPGWDPGIDLGLIDKPFPLLGAGGIIKRATMAVVGEAGPEAVIPLDNLWDNLYYAMEHTRPSGGVHQVHMDNRSINISFENTFNVDLPNQRVVEITRTQTRTALEEYQRFKYQMRR